jgi:hypothetical protein
MQKVNCFCLVLMVAIYFFRFYIILGIVTRRRSQCFQYNKCVILVWITTFLRARE